MSATVQYRTVVGSAVLIGISARNRDGKLTNVTSLDMTLTTPSATISYTIGDFDNVSVGRYDLSYVADELGLVRGYALAIGSGIREAVRFEIVVT